MLERYGHGGDLLTAGELYGRSPEGFVDFSANMNPFGPPGCVADILRSYAGTIGRYPDPAVRGLRRKLAAQHEVDERCIVIGNGAAELIELTARIFAPAATVVTAPSFAEYRDAALKAGSRIMPIVLRPEDGFVLTSELARRTAASLRAEGIAAGEALWYIGSPNNPTGALCEPAIIRELAAAGENIVVDEAFLDFIPDSDKRWSLLRDAACSDRLIVIRSMTKFYAIPGIRLGYAAASPEVAERLRRLQTPWSVNSLAQQIGEAVLEDHPYRERALSWLPEERGWLSGKLSALGFKVFDSAANYMLLALPEHWRLSSTELQRRLGARGVLVRDGAHFPGLNDRYIRIAVRLRPDNERLIGELSELAGEQEL